MLQLWMNTVWHFLYWIVLITKDENVGAAILRILDFQSIEFFTNFLVENEEQSWL